MIIYLLQFSITTLRSRIRRREYQSRQYWSPLETQEQCTRRFEYFTGKRIISTIVTQRLWPEITPSRNRQRGNYCDHIRVWFIHVIATYELIDCLMTVILWTNKNKSTHHSKQCIIIHPDTKVRFIGINYDADEIISFELFISKLFWKIPERKMIYFIINYWYMYFVARSLYEVEYSK